MNLRVALCDFTMAMEDYALHFPVVEIQNTVYGHLFCSPSVRRSAPLPPAFMT